MATTTMFNVEVIHAQILDSLQHSIDEAINAIVESAKADVEKRIRDEAGRHVINLSEWVSVERMGSTMRIELLKRDD